jgi:hypothetical protein
VDKQLQCERSACAERWTTPDAIAISSLRNHAQLEPLVDVTQADPQNVRAFIVIPGAQEGLILSATSTERSAEIEGEGVLSAGPSIPARGLG